MTIIARYNGRCAKCHATITAGEQVEWSRATRRVSHPTCSQHAQCAPVVSQAAPIARRQPTVKRAAKPVSVATMLDKLFPSEVTA